jgi:hypothetical protein
MEFQIQPPKNLSERFRGKENRLANSIHDSVTLGTGIISQMLPLYLDVQNGA